MVRTENQKKCRYSYSGSICHVSWVSMLNSKFLVACKIYGGFGLYILPFYTPTSHTPRSLPSSEQWRKLRDCIHWANEKPVPIFLIWDHCRFICLYKKWYRTIPCTLPPVSPSSNILPNCNTVSGPGCCHCQDTEHLHHHKDPSCCPFVGTPASLSPPPPH